MNVQIDNRVSRTPLNPSLKFGIGSELVDHANRLGIKLRSAGRNRQTPRSQERNASARRANTAISESRNWAILNTWTNPQAYVQDVVVPLSSRTVTDEENIRQSISRQSVSGGNKQPLPHMRAGSAHSQKSTSTYLEKYVSSTPNETSVLQDSKANKKKIWNNSGQALRYQHEQESKEKSRTKKRTSVVQPHRVDRMYYISGTSLQMPGKYEVDYDEMDRLRDMARIRREATHYGKGLSHEKRKLVGVTANDDIQVPNQPPNSQMENLPDIGPLSPSQIKPIDSQHNPGPGGDQNGSNKNISNDIEGFSLKGVGLEGKRNTHSASVTVRVVNEGSAVTPHNSARTEKTAGHNIDEDLTNDTQNVFPPIPLEKPDNNIVCHENDLAKNLNNGDTEKKDETKLNNEDIIEDKVVEDNIDSKQEPSVNPSPEDLQLAEQEVSEDIEKSENEMEKNISNNENES